MESNPRLDGIELSLSPVSPPVWLTGCAFRLPERNLAMGLITKSNRSRSRTLLQYETIFAKSTSSPNDCFTLDGVGSFAVPEDDEMESVGRVGLNLDDTSLRRNHNRLRSIANVESPQDDIDVPFDGASSDIQRF